MAQEPRPLVAGNWKMNGLAASVAELQAVVARASSQPPGADLLICPPATLIARFAEAAKGSIVAIGAQDCHTEPSGAFTGDLSAEMLKDAGATAVIVGHSERRSLHGETDDTVRAKAEAANRAGLTAIVCVGETREEREAGATIARIQRQLGGSLPEKLDGIVVAYEPVWAIGSGLTPTASDIREVHGMIRKYLTTQDESAGSKVRILYGGSVKPQNAKELMAVANVNGALVGGASLKATDFLGIAAAYS
ncbi:MAG: triose-phosphate isomerase [Pseudorhodoplanes sp.]|uniref:triose-phosphate isomerase n=1 Tax=Pseudorhodoplanes sp. TaxID=1934341 RepID=UPI003D0E8229